jgi:FkbM family methyltransferase
MSTNAFYPQWVLKNRYANKVIRVLGRGSPPRLMHELGEPGDIPLQMLGSDYGGWFVPISIMDKSWIIYSLGIGQDTSFDHAVIDQVGAHVFGFDPTPPALEHIDERKRTVPAYANFHFQALAVWSTAMTLRLFEPKTRGWVGSYSALNLQGTERYIDVPAKPLSMLMQELGHQHIDLLKMDIEGAEHGVIATMLEQKLPVRWLCVEFDQPIPLATIRTLIKRLIGAGYRLRHVDRWNFTFQHVDR